MPATEAAEAAVLLLPPTLEAAGAAIFLPVRSAAAVGVAVLWLPSDAAPPTTAPFDVEARTDFGNGLTILQDRARDGQGGLNTERLVDQPGILLVTLGPG